MRIVGGSLRGRKLAVPKSQAIRPTTDRNRESLFNILNHHWPEKLQATRVLDVFAGTGALGIEAISRGAAFSVFIELSAEGRGLLRDNIESLGLTGKTKVFRRDALRPGAIGSIQPFDLVFADPPYGKKLGEAAAAKLYEDGWLNAGSLLVLEESKDSMPDNLAEFKKVDERNFGETMIGFFELITVK
ncbi:MAG: 16S rRNA (guanine(966)-N(2))-methyltransferase RsmD [Rhizobiaceae bacterium]